MYDTSPRHIGSVPTSWPQNRSFSGSDCGSLSKRPHLRNTNLGQLQHAHFIERLLGLEVEVERHPIGKILACLRNIWRFGAIIVQAFGVGNVETPGVSSSKDVLGKPSSQPTIK